MANSFGSLVDIAIKLSNISPYFLIDNYSSTFTSLCQTFFSKWLL